MIKYLNYDNIEISKELKKIENTDLIELVIDPKNKVCLFILGIAFAKGKKIRILNLNDLDLNKTEKSFSVMTYVWDKLGDNNFPNENSSNVVTEMDKRIENIKRLGVKVEPVVNMPIYNKIFLICPVRNATEKDRKWIEDFVYESEVNGIKVHAPHLHTTQTDLFGGYAICRQNALAVATSREIDIYYDKESTGSVFDLGVAYALNKPLRLLNGNIILDSNDFIDKIIKECELVGKKEDFKMTAKEARNIITNIWSNHINDSNEEIQFQKVKK